MYEAGKPVADLKTSSWKESSELSINGIRFTIKRDRPFRGPFLLLDGEKVLASADKPSAVKNRFEIEYLGNIYVLKKKSVWKREFVLELGNSVVGSIKPEGYFSRSSAIVLPAEFPLILQIFIFWLALIIWKREDATVAAS